jgi:hypothetical protein
LGSLLEEGPPEVRKVNHSVMRADWIDPEDLRPNVRAGRTITGHRAYCPLRWCIRRHGSRSSFNENHILAADRLRAAWDGARIGFSGLKDWRPVQAILYRPSQGPTTSAMRQLKCRKEFDKAWALFDDRARALLASVVLQNRALGPTADVLGISKPLASQTLTEALDVLVGHFDLGRRAKAA